MPTARTEQAVSYRAPWFYGGTFRGTSIEIENAPWIEAGALQTAAGATGLSLLSPSGTPAAPRLRALLGDDPISVLLDGEDLRVRINLGIIFVRTAADLGTPVGGVYILEVDRAYVIAQNVDLGGNGLQMSAGASLRGLTEGGITLSSTGLPPGTPLVETVHDLYLSNLRLEGTGTGIRSTAPPHGLFVRHTEFEGFAQAIRSVGVPDLYVERCVFDGGEAIEWDGGVHARVVGSKLESTSALALIRALPGSVLTEHFDVLDCYFEVYGAGTVGVDVTGVTAPDRGIAIRNTRFEGPGTPVVGLAPGDLAADFVGNIGLDESRILGLLWAVANATPTPIAVSGDKYSLTLDSSTLATETQRFARDAGLHGVTFQASKPTGCLVDATIELNGQGNNRELRAWAAVRPAGQGANPAVDFIPNSEGAVETDASRPMTLVVQTFVNLGQGDTVYLVVANLSNTADILVRNINLRVSTPAHL